MSCSYTRDEISDVVIDTLSQVLKEENITEESELEADLGLDRKARELLFFPIEKSVIKVGCKFKKFTTTSCGKASAVGDIVDIIAKDFEVEA
jgi:hypothetical protein